MDTQPPPASGRRMTWIDSAGTTWRVERITDRWQLSRYSPSTETWTRIGSFPSKSAAIQAAYGENKP